MDLGISNQVIIITGGGGGIGSEAARAFAAEGCKVVVWDLDIAKAKRVADSIRDNGGQAIDVGGSVANSEDVEAAVRRVIKEFNDIHILVNNAGFGDDAPLVEMTNEQWHRVIDVCLTGSFYCSRAVAPYMIKQKYGRIINVASRAHLGGLLNRANYSAAKAGMLGLSRETALELAEHNITVNTVHPGMVPTDRLRGLAAYPQLKEGAERLQMIKRLATPSDIVNAILFFASARTSFITGDQLYVTGGRYG